MLNTKKHFFSLFPAAVVVIIASMSCGRFPTGVSQQTTGDVELQIQLFEGMGKRTVVKKTGFDSLVVEVSGTDMAPFRSSCAIDPEQLFLIDTLSGIPVGSDRKIRIMTINREGEVIHEDSAGVRTAWRYTASTPTRS